MSEIFYKQTGEHEWTLTGSEKIFLRADESININGNIYSRSIDLPALLVIDEAEPYQYQSSLTNITYYKLYCNDEQGNRHKLDMRLYDIEISIAPFFVAKIHRFSYDRFSPVFYRIRDNKGKIILPGTSKDKYIAFAQGLLDYFGIAWSNKRMMYIGPNSQLRYSYEALEYDGGHTLDVEFGLDDLLHMDVSKFNFNKKQLSRLKRRIEEIKFLKKRTKNNLLNVFERPFDDWERLEIAANIFKDYSQFKK